MFQISEVLKKVPFFQALGKDGIDFIIERLKFKPFDRTEAVCKAGDPGDKMYIIISGNVKVVVAAEPAGEETVIANLGSGNYFGEMSLLTGEPRSASVITTEPSEMFILNKVDFDVIIERFPSITLSMTKIMSQRLRETNQMAAKKGGEAITAVEGDLSEKKLVEVLKFCENNSLNGKVLVTHDGNKGEFHYKKGELQKVMLNNLPEDKALDTMLNWQSGKFVIEPRPIHMEDAKTAKQKPQQKFIIVIVNNSMVVQKLLQRAFDSMGYEVYAVETAAKAMNMVKSMRPHLIISDTKLPDSGGVAFVQSVRGITNVPVVLLTESANRAQMEDQAKSQGKVYFTNSQEVGEVIKIVEGALQ
jgi:CRP-like cAMP-binding protein/CheY-like chemotaxis protein